MLPPLKSYNMHLYQAENRLLYELMHMEASLFHNLNPKWINRNAFSFLELAAFFD